MSIAVGLITLVIVMLAIDLLTAPKCGQTVARTKLKDSRHAA